MILINFVCLTQKHTFVFAFENNNVGFWSLEFLERNLIFLFSTRIACKHVSEPIFCFVQHYLLFLSMLAIIIKPCSHLRLNLGAGYCILGFILK